MNGGSLQTLAAYWSTEAVETNLLIFANLVGALLLGFVVGYERHYHGRFNLGRQRNRCPGWRWLLCGRDPANPAIRNVHALR
jgi:hypothetical protein